VQGTLANAELRFDTNANQTWLFEFNGVSVGQAKSVESRPLLASYLDVLPGFIADCADTRRLVCVGVLGAACCANEVWHECVQDLAMKIGVPWDLPTKDPILIENTSFQ
jgi:hypothetical protein